eukprot:scaffold116767_cov57-Attheya_sp.AAC.1
MPWTRRIEREPIQLIPSNLKWCNGKKNPADSNSKTRVWKLRARRRTQREPFDAFSAKVFRRKWRQGKEMSETSIERRKNKKRERKKEIERDPAERDTQ